MPAPLTLSRPARLVTPVPDQDLYVGGHTCGPLLQHELLQATSILSPLSYERAVQRGLTLERTRAQVKRGGVINALPVIRLARLITADPSGYDIFGLSGINLADRLRQRMLPSLGFTMNFLPWLMRIHLAMATMQRYKHHFVGSRSRLLIHRDDNHLYVGVIDSIFSGREDTLIGGSELQRRAIEAVLRDFARVQCRVVRVMPRRARLNEAWFEVVRSSS
ncbi:MAG TPA: hypothetical protein VNQ79_22885 [Blastocatellia bacterium]|nr:hypothetical protein [Blastocatellia bacterium]